MARSDAELLESWRTGDHSAGDALVARHFFAVYGFFRTKASDVADDLTQQTFLACVESRDRIDPERGFRGFLFGIARHKLLSYFEKMAGPLGRWDPHRSSIMSIANVRGLVTAREQQRLVLDAMARLPMDVQITLELHYWWGMTLQEIADATEVAVGTVKSRLSRGRELLRQELESLEANPAARELALQSWRQRPDLERASST